MTEEFKCFVKNCKIKWRYKSRNYKIACCEKHFQKFCTEIIKQLAKWDFIINLDETEEERKDKELALELVAKSVRLKRQLEIIDKQLKEINKRSKKYGKCKNKKDAARADFGRKSC